MQVMFGHVTACDSLAISVAALHLLNGADTSKFQPRLCFTLDFLQGKQIRFLYEVSTIEPVKEEEAK
jgi:hypothetical protein